MQVARAIPLAVFFRGFFVADATGALAESPAACAALASLPLVGMATRSVYGEDLLLAAGVDYKPYIKLIDPRRSRGNDRWRSASGPQARVSIRYRDSLLPAHRAAVGMPARMPEQWTDQDQSQAPWQQRH